MESAEGAVGGREAGGSPGGHRSTRTLMAIDDGLADPYIERMRGATGGPRMWDRWKHTLLADAPPLSRLFPISTSVIFNSPSVTAAFLPDFISTATLPSKSILEDGGGEYSGPGCLVRHLSQHTTLAVVRTLLAVLAPTAVAACPDGQHECASLRSGALVVGLHLRRGDKAMLAECRECINLDDPDVQEGEKDRIEMKSFIQQLHRVNRTVGMLRLRLQRDVVVFVASDTVLGLSHARALLGENNVVSLSGQAVHSTRTLAGGAVATPDAVKVAGDFLALATSDVLLSVSGSSFSGNAAAMNRGVTRMEGHIHDLSPNEIEALRSSLQL